MYYSPPEISVQELAQKIAEQSELVQLIDVREPQETDYAALPGFVVLPLSQFPQWRETITTRFNPDLETIVLCHHGIRSAQMCQWLQEQGFIQVANVSGGIDAYSRMVDRSIPRY